MFKRLFETYRLGKLTRKTRFTVTDKKGSIYYHAPLEVIVNHVKFLHGLTEFPETKEAFLTGQIKLVWTQTD